MRKEIFRMPREAAIALLARAPVFHLATTRADGAPVLRALHGVVVGELLAFHAAPVGEKVEGLGRPAVAGAEEIVAAIPSYFLDPERACPATTYFESVQVHGVLERVDDPGTKAAVLAGLMAKLQPEGGHVPITADEPLYRKAVDGLLVAGLRLEHVDGKAKLGQNRALPDLARVVAGLRARNAPGDAGAVARIRAANPALDAWLPDDVAAEATCPRRPSAECPRR